MIIEAAFSRRRALYSRDLSLVAEAGVPLRRNGRLKRCRFGSAQLVRGEAALKIQHARNNGAHATS